MKTLEYSVCAIALTLLLQLSLSIGVTNAQEPELWLGDLDVKVATLRLEVRISADENGDPTAKMFSLDQNNAEIKVESIDIDGDQVSMKMPSVGAEFEGQLNETKDQCTGVFTQGGQEFPLTFNKVEKIVEPTHVATWAGILKAAGKEFEFQLRVFDTDGELSAKLDSFTESAIGLSTNFSQSGNDFEFEVPLSAGKFEGKLNEDKTQVTGKWIQGGGKFDLVFDAVAIEDTRKLVRKRPQTPTGPFPYDVSEVSFTNKQAKITLAGTLTTPKGDGPFATVVLVSGSGAQDRDETILGHKPFAVLADHLTRAGVAVFRYDERGVGESTGTYAGSTTEDFASDVEAIIAGLRKTPKVRKDKIGIIGHSEGGLVAPMIAAKDRKLGFIVLMAGPGVPGKQILLTQSRAIAKASGVPQEALDINEQILKGVLEQVSPENQAKNIVNGVLDQLKSNLSEQDQKKFELPESAKDQFGQFETPWFRFFNVYDPIPALRKTTCPVLSVIGEKDLQVDCEMNQAAIEDALESGKCKDFTISKLANLNHLFQACETGSVSEYSKIEETLNPAFLELVTNWIIERIE